MQFINSLLGFGSNPTPIPEVVSTRPKRSTGDLLPRLAEVRTKEERDLALNKHVETIFDDSLHWPAVDLHQFASFHLQAYHQGISSLPLGSVLEGVDFWIHYLSLWQRGKGSIIPFGVSNQQMSAIEEELKIYREFLQRISPEEEHEGHDTYLEKTAQTFMTLLQQYIKERGRCYLPLGYRGGAFSGGHAIPVLFEKKGKSILAHVLNKGEGAENHPQTHWIVTKDLRTFRYPPIKIDEETLFGPVGLSFLERQIQLLTTKPKDSAPVYNAQDLYGALLILGKLETSYGVDLESIQGKSQTGHVCADMASRLVVIDHLQVYLKGCPQERNRMVFNAKLCSFIQMSHALEEKGPAALQVWSLAYRELCVAVNERSDGRLNAEEIALCHAILERGRQKMINARLVESLHLPFSFQNVSFAMNCRADFSYSPELANALPCEQDLRTHGLIPETIFHPSTFLSTLKNWCTYLLGVEPLNGTELQASFIMRFIMHAVEGLPIPSAIGADIWDLLPQEQVEECLKWLQMLQKPAGYGLAYSKSLFVPTFLMLHTIYAIADKLARRLPETQLEGFASPYTLHDLPLQYQTMRCLLLGKENARLVKIEAYFHALTIHHPHHAFHFDSLLHINPEIDRMRIGRLTETRFGQSLGYLRQLIPHCKMSAPDIANLWLDSDNLLPPAVSALRCISYAAYKGVATQGRMFLLYSDFADEFEKVEYHEHIALAPKKSDPLELGSDGLSALLSRLNEQNPLPESYAITRMDPDHFVPLSATLTPKLTANEAYCLASHCGVKDLSTASFRELKAIGCVSNLQAVSIIAWAIKYRTELENPLVQSALGELLFAPNSLQKQLEQEPQLIPGFRQFAQEGINAYAKTERADLFLYYFRLAYFIETHIMEVWGNQWQSEEQIQLYRTQIKDSLLTRHDAHEIRYHLLLSYTHCHVLTHQDLQEVVCHRFFLTQRNQGLPESLKVLESHYESLWQKIEIQLDDIISNSAFIHDLCETLRQQCTGEPTSNTSSKGIWTGTSPRYFLDNYHVDFHNAIVSKNGKPHLTPLLQACEVGVQFKDFIDPLETFVWKEKYYEALNSNQRLIRNHSYDLQQTFKVDGEKDWYQLSPNRNSFPFCGRDAVWRCTSNPARYLLTTRQAKPKLLAQVFITPLETHEIRLDAQGNSTRLLLMDVSDANPAALPWHQKAIALGSHSFLRCYVDRVSGLVSLVEFLDLKLVFRGERFEGNWILRCDQYPSYWLSREQTLPELPGFLDLLVLENGSGERLAILPNRPFGQRQQGLNDPIDSECSQFLFEVANLRLYSDSAEANLALAERCAASKHYPNALFYLSRCRSYQVGFLELCESRFLKWLDKSPEGLAFTLRVALHSLEERQLLVRQVYQGKSEIYYRKFWTEIPQFYTQYLNVVGAGEEQGSVPSYIRLSTEEELKLLGFLHEKKDSFDWNYALENRLRLAREPTSLTVRIGNAQVEQFPAELTCVPPSKEFITLPTSQISLPGRVRTPKDELVASAGFWLRSAQTAGTQFPSVFDLDLFYLVRSVPKKDWTSQLSEILSVLVYVRNYPNDFAKIDFMSADMKKAFDLAREKTRTLIENDVVLPSQYTQSFARVYIPQKDLVLQLPRSAPIAPRIWPKPLKHTISANTPLQKLRESLFTVTKKSGRPKSVPFYLTDMFLKPETALEKRLFQQLLIGFEKNVEQSNFHYSLKEEWNSQLRPHQEHRIACERNQLTALRAQIEMLANWLPEDGSNPLSTQQISNDYLTRIRRGAQLKPLITLDGELLAAFLQDNVAAVQKINPNLTHDQFQRLYSLLGQYFTAAIQLHQREDLVKCLRNIENASGPVRDHYIQCLGRLLDERLDHAHPVLVVYQYLAKKRLTSEQISILLWIIQSPLFRGPTSTPALAPLLFAFKAGGGKTSVLLTILMQIALSKGFFPVSIAPTALYHVERHNQSTAFKGVFNLSLSVLELGLEDDVDPDLWRRTYKRLKDDHAKGRGLIMEPTSYHALRLHYLLALDQKQTECVRWLSKILNFFSTKALAFIDECSRNLDPLLQTNLGIERSCKVSSNHFKILLACYLPMLDPLSSPVTLEDGRTLGQVLKLAEGKQASIAVQDKIRCRLALAKHMTHHPLLKLSQKEKELFLPYWLEKAQPRPVHLEQMYKNDPDRAEIISLLRGFFTQYYDFTLKLVTSVDHGPSLNESEPFETPRQDTLPSLCAYEDPYVAACVSAQAVLQKPLRVDQVIALVNKLRSLHDTQKQFSVDHYAHLFKNWIESDSPSLEEISTEKWLGAPSKIESALIQTLSKNTAAKTWYLEHILFPAITYKAQHLTSTARHLASGFNGAVLFSATPGLPELSFLHENHPQYRSDYPALEAVQHRFCCTPSDQVIFSSRDPLTFFKEIAEKRPHLFPACCAMIDPENALRKGNTEIAKAFLTFAMQNNLPYDGVLYYQDADKEMEGSSDTLIFWSSLGERPQPLIGGDVESAFSKIGLNRHKMRIMTLFDASHTLGANIVLPFDGSILYVMAENLTLDKSTQALKRDRQILDRPAKDLVVAIPEYLFQTIPPDQNDQISAKALTFWTLKNQASKLKEKLITNVYQEIQLRIEQILHRDLIKNLHSPEEQIRLFHQHRAGVVQPYILSPYQRFSLSSQQKNSSQVLLEFAQTCYERYGYSESWENAYQLQKQVHETISTFQTLVPQLPNQPHTIGKGIRMHAVEKQEVQQHQIGSQNLVPIKPNLKLPLLDIDGFVAAFIQRCQSAQTAFHSNSLTSGLYYTNNALNCAKSNGKRLGVSYLPPVDYLLIIQQDLSFTACALTLEEAGLFKEQLLHPRGGLTAHRALLVNNLGWVVQQGKGSLALSVADQKALLTSTWFKDIIVDVSLIQGQFRFHDRLMDRLPQWPDFGAFWQRITRHHPHPEHLHLPPLGPIADAIGKEPELLPQPTAQTEQTNASILGAVDLSVLNWLN